MDSYHIEKIKLPEFEEFLTDSNNFQTQLSKHSLDAESNIVSVPTYISSTPSYENASISLVPSDPLLTDPLPSTPEFPEYHFPITKLNSNDSENHIQKKSTSETISITSKINQIQSIFVSRDVESKSEKHAENNTIFSPQTINDIQNIFDKHDQNSNLSDSVSSLSKNKVNTVHEENFTLNADESDINVSDSINNGTPDKNHTRTKSDQKTSSQSVHPALKEARFIKRIEKRLKIQTQNSFQPHNSNSAENSNENSNYFLKRTIFTPLHKFTATLLMKKQAQEKEASVWPSPLDIRETEELPTIKASKYYASQLSAIKPRLIASFFLTLISIWIGLGLPCAGQLNNSLYEQNGVSLILLLSIMICNLDIFTLGIQQIFNLQFSLEALLSINCFLSIIDGIISMEMLSDNLSCAPVCALMLTVALANEYILCLTQSLNFRTASYSKNPSALHSLQHSDSNDYFLVRTPPGHFSFVRNSEDSDILQNTFISLSPLILLFCFILSLFIAFYNKSWNMTIHYISGFLSVFITIGAFSSFIIPYFISVLHSRKAGGSIAGWLGCSIIGESHKIVIRDEDLFPKRKNNKNTTNTETIRLTAVNILDGEDPKKVVSYAVSVLNESKSCVINAFEELMNKRHYDLLTVEDFKCHDGGGFSAYIHNESVLVGSIGFMHLMGISIPKELYSETSIAIAVSNELIGVFDLQYIPVEGVRKSLNILLQGHIQPIFAIRDFNITPLMIQKLFHISAINFEFPSFRERYKLSTDIENTSKPVSAILVQDSLRCAVETAEIGRKLYLATIIGLILSLLESLLGVIFIILRAIKGLAILTCSNLLLYLLLGLIPFIIIDYWVYRK